MTSEQTDALWQIKHQAALFVAAAAAFTHAFGQDHPDITATVESAAQGVGETAHTLAAWGGGPEAKG